MLVYRIKHLPTGLYYIPRHGTYAGKKTNLSKNGKVYINTKPSLEHIRHCMDISDKQMKEFPTLLVKLSAYEKQYMLPWNETEWEIITYTLIDKE